jgi:hypothetical protein
MERRSLAEATDRLGVVKQHQMCVVIRDKGRGKWTRNGDT